MKKSTDENKEEKTGPTVECATPDILSSMSTALPRSIRKVSPYTFLATTSQLSFSYLTFISVQQQATIISAVCSEMALNITLVGLLISAPRIHNAVTYIDNGTTPHASSWSTYRRERRASFFLRVRGRSLIFHELATYSPGNVVEMEGHIALGCTWGCGVGGP